MNPVLNVIHQRKSIRAFEKREISEETKSQIIQASLRAPTAGNMMLYSIIDVTLQDTKDKLVRTCDNQPFIARAPLVLLYLADWQRWYDYFHHAGVEKLLEKRGETMRKPQEGNLFLACCDALIAAQTAVIAAESLGIGSTYIGDILENYEIHQAMFNLPKYVFPVCLVCFGYPTPQQADRQLTDRFDEQHIVFRDQYRQLSPAEFDNMFQRRQNQMFQGKEKPGGIQNVGQLTYLRKFASDFAIEMSRSVRVMLEAWTED